MKIVTMPSAVRDLNQIHDYIAQFDPDAASAQLRRIEVATKRLMNYPKSAPCRPDAGPDARGMVCDRYVILYRLRDESVQIVRIIHQARDYAGILDDH